MYRLDLKTWRWELVDQGGQVPQPRDEHTGSLYQGQAMIVFGGFVDGVRTN